MKINFKDKNTITLMIILGIVTVVTIGLGAVYFLSGPSGVKVEDFVGKPVQEVMSWADSSKLADNQIEYIYQYDETVAKDTVMSQSMTKEDLIKKDGKISFVVSKGSDPDLMISLPDFTTMNKDQLHQFFEENKFTDVTYEYTIDPKIEKDMFLKINIEGNEARRSDLIIVTISVGKTNVGVDITMPDFAESSKENIQAWGKTNNITITFKTESSDTIATGKLISQSVKAGETIQTGSKVTIVLSGGKGITMNDMTGKTKAEVEAWAKESGAKVDFLSYYADSTAEGKVISTSPKSGSVSTGTTIKVYLSLGPIKVSDLTDKKDADVKTWIATVNKSIYDKNNYITYEVKTDTSSNKAAGTILKTSPAKSEVVKLGGKITITVAGQKMVTVDSKSNITVDELKKYLEGLGMKLGSKSSEVFSDSIASGKVVRNDSGSKAAGTSINYTTSKGAFAAGSYTSLGACQSAINQEGVSGWSCSSKEEFHDTVAKGGFIRQETNGKSIVIVVSKGAEPKPVTVPNFSGKSLNELTTFLSQNGLKTGSVSFDFHETIAEGSIISNDTGSKLPGAAINYVVSKGKKPVIQDIAITNGQVAALDNCIADGNPETTKSNIETYIKGLGFANPSVTIISDDQPSGKIVSTGNFAAGSFAPDTVFNITVSKGPGSN